MEVKEFVVTEDMGGHDGLANGGSYGDQTVLFGIFSDDAVTVGETEKLGAIHSYRPGRLAIHHSKCEFEWSYETRLLRPSDFVALERRHTAQCQFVSRYGDIEILAHRLPIGAKIPQNWVPVNGTRNNGTQGGEESHDWTLLDERGSPTAWEDAVAKIGLTAIQHPYGVLWLAGEQPVAINEMPRHTGGGDDYSYSFRAILGDLGFFHANGFSVREEESHSAKYAAYGNYSKTQCSREIIRQNLDIQNLREGGWYPVEINSHMVVWGTGLKLYPKHLAWQVGLEKAAGTTADTFRGIPADSRGTRIFDSSPNRLERVQQFFSEAVGVAITDPEAEYVRWANSTDPRGGKWRNSHQYPASWTPHFSGWRLSRFGGVECRWKQPKSGAARFYGLLRKAGKIERLPAATSSGTAMADAFRRCKTLSA